IVAERLVEIFRSAPKGMNKPERHAPGADIAGRWSVSVVYEAGSAEPEPFVETHGHRETGRHLGWAFKGELRGVVDGDKVKLRTSLPVGGQRLPYLFSGRINGGEMAGDVDLGEYGRARWTAKRSPIGNLSPLPVDHR